MHRNYSKLTLVPAFGKLGTLPGIGSPARANLMKYFCVLLATLCERLYCKVRKYNPNKAYTGLHATHLYVKTWL